MLTKKHAFSVSAPSQLGQLKIGEQEAETGGHAAVKVHGTEIVRSPALASVHSQLNCAQPQFESSGQRFRSTTHRQLP